MAFNNIKTDNNGTNKNKIKTYVRTNRPKIDKHMKPNEKKQSNIYAKSTHSKPNKHSNEIYANHAKQNNSTKNKHSKAIKQAIKHSKNIRKKHNQVIKKQTNYEPSNFKLLKEIPIIYDDTDSDNDDNTNYRLKYMKIPLKDIEIYSEIMLNLPTCNQ